MALNKGFVTRTNGKVALRILRGHNLESSQSLHRSAPVAADEVIYSGMLITLSWVSGNSRYEWVKGGPATWSSAASEGAPLLYWAYTDYNKEDVVASDKLIGLPCSGQYILQTPYFTGTAANFKEGDYITHDGTTGSVKLVTDFETANQPIIGQVTLINGARDLVLADQGLLPDAPYPEDISGGLGTQPVISFRTMFLPNLADAT